MKIALLVATSLLFITGCSFNGFAPQSHSNTAQEVVVQKVDRDDLLKIMQDENLVSPLPQDVTLTANGEGIAPLNTVSVAQARVLAKRSAMAAAYANLAGKLYGVRIDGEDTVKDAMLQNSRVSARVQGLVKNAEVIDEGFANGLYKVTLQLRIDQRRWKEVFAY